MTMQADLNKPNASLWEAMHWEPSSSQIEQFIFLQKLLNHFNAEVNLTRLLQGDDFWVGQVFDSLWPLQKELKDPK